VITDTSSVGEKGAGRSATHINHGVGERCKTASSSSISV
jgi:hypothetical protein